MVMCLIKQQKTVFCQGFLRKPCKLAIEHTIVMVMRTWIYSWFKRGVVSVLLGLILSVSIMQILPIGVYAQGTPLGSGVCSDMECVYNRYINPLISVLSVTAGIAVVVGIIWGGIQYSMSAGDSNKVTKAKQTITRSLIGLVAFLLLGSFLQFLSPTNLTGRTDLKPGETCASRVHFLSMKPWYAYLPASSFDSDCSLKETVEFFPQNGGKSVLPQVLLAVADDLLRVAALVAVAFVVTGGIKYITSRGQPNETKMALSSIINALIGLAIAMFAAVIVSFIGGQLIK